jgi:hypothetical protein
MMGSTEVGSRAHFLEGLLELSRAGDRAARRALWRQSIVSLGHATAQRGPAPLEGVEPNALVPAVRIALGDGLLDDLEWLSPDAAAVAFYEIAAALPAGVEKREVGRRVATYTYDGAADTFAAVATRMALGSNKALSVPPLGARVSLVLELPFGESARTPALALALASRRELVKEWIARPSRGSLPARRLAARLIERGAAEAARLSASGEDDAARVFRAESLARSYRELLWDREPLVWKHAAIARGLLATTMPELADEIEAHLAPGLSPTEWRRAATSLGASVAAEPASASRRIRDWLKSGVLERDPDVAGCVVWGLAHAATLEPDAAEQILLAMAETEGAAIAESFEQAARDQPSWRRTRAAELLRQVLRRGLSSGTGSDEASCRGALANELLDDLAPPPPTLGPDGLGARLGFHPSSLRRAVASALSAFAGHGPKRAYDLAISAVALAHDRVSALEALPRDPTAAQPEKLALLRDLDIGLLQSATLPNLLALNRRLPDAGASHQQAMETLHDRLCSAILAEEAAERHDAKGARPSTLPMQRIKALIHVLDGDVEPTVEDELRSAAVRGRSLEAVHTLARRFASFAPAKLPRSLGAALARALESLVRAESCDSVDVLLFAASRFAEPEPLGILADACKQPELGALFAQYAALLRQQRGGDDADELRRRLDALERFSRELSSENSGREQALRAVLVKLSRSLEAVHGASSVSDLAVVGHGGESVLGALAEAVSSLVQMVAASSQRMFCAAAEEGPVSARHPTSGLMRAAHRAASGAPSNVPQSIDDLLDRLGPALPRPIGALVASTLARARNLPKTVIRAEGREKQQEPALPSWMPPRRTLGGFHVVRPLGTGGEGSVFVVKRIEERDDPSAESLALKVPAWTAQIGRHMSEAAFLQRFQSEASALLSLPLHRNLARFVTFDLGARPKPILVMELVAGISLDLVITRRQLKMAGALAILDGVLAGLEAMHAAGIAHLDVKPSNVVLRNGKEPVLVDFGLAGRQIRPGCGSGPYGSPEVWGVVADDGSAPATFADVYSAACLVYETLTTQPLFDQPTEVALIAAHVAHDGWPTPLRSWHRQAEIAEVAELVGRGLRRRPRDRIDIATFRKKLASLAPVLSELSWPLSP